MDTFAESYCSANVGPGHFFVLAQNNADWSFAVSGDSRNCGDIVMPAIAKSAHADNAAFYWHLGDFRALYAPDEDLLQLGMAS